MLGTRKSSAMIIMMWQTPFIIGKNIIKHFILDALKNRIQRYDQYNGSLATVTARSASKSHPDTQLEALYTN